MFCALPVNELLAALLLPSSGSSGDVGHVGALSESACSCRPRVRIAMQLSQTHVDTLLTAAERYFCGRVNATARALLDAAMQQRLQPLHPAIRCITADEPEWTLFTMQIDLVHRDWLQAWAPSNEDVHSVLRAVIDNFLDMPDNQKRSVLSPTRDFRCEHVHLPTRGTSASAHTVISTQQSSDTSLLSHS